jgi:hypothetical protein
MHKSGILIAPPEVSLQLNPSSLAAAHWHSTCTGRNAYHGPSISTVISRAAGFLEVRVLSEKPHDTLVLQLYPQNKQQYIHEQMGLFVSGLVLASQTRMTHPGFLRHYFSKKENNISPVTR